MDPRVPLTTEQGLALLQALDEWLDTPRQREKHPKRWVTVRLATDRMRVALKTYS